MNSHRTYFVSDLHLYTLRSEGHAYVDEIGELAADADAFVLGGDIFDFRWTTLDSVAATIDTAVSWIDELARSAPACRFYFLLGNHDHHAGFIAGLDDVQAARENLSWDPYYFRLGNSLFLHGDAADYTARLLSLERIRSRTLEETKKGRTAHLLYELGDPQRLATGRCRCWSIPSATTARRLMSYIDEIGHGVDTGLEHVYFGHTPPGNVPLPLPRRLLS